MQTVARSAYFLMKSCKDIKVQTYKRASKESKECHLGLHQVAYAKERAELAHGYIQWFPSNMYRSNVK